MASGKDQYSDIYNRPHHVSSKRPQMSKINRAAQFSPFAALSGYDESVVEAARVTGKRIELSDDDLGVLNERVLVLREHLSERPEVTVTYFEPDKIKSGGTYLDHTGVPHKINEFDRAIIFEDGLIILLDDIIAITGKLYHQLELQ